MKRKILAALLMLLALASGVASHAATLSITRVWPERICYKPGETASILVALSNAGKTTETARLTVSVRWGLDGIDPLAATTLVLRAGAPCEVSLAYPIPSDRKWGHEVVATVADEKGALQSTAREYFTVGRNPWEVGHYITAFGMRDAEKNGRVDRDLLPRWRKDYITTVEAYSWMPSCFDNMSPTSDVWRSGQGWYVEGKAGWQYVVKQAHAQGMAVVTYIQSISYGPEGFEFARRHPEWLTYQKDGRPNAWFDVDKLAAGTEKPESLPPDTFGGITTGGFLPDRQQVGDYWIAEVMRSKEMFGWDGFRSDGNPGVTAGYDYTGKPYEVPDPGEANAAFLRKVRRVLTERYPDFLFGWNNVAGGYPQMYNKSPEEAVMLQGAYSLFEHFNSAAQPSSPFHPWRKAAF